MSRGVERASTQESASCVRRIDDMARAQQNRFSRRSFLGQSIAVAAALGAATGFVACGAPASPAATSASGTAAPAQTAQSNGTAKTLNLVWSGWILDQNPVINTLIANYAKETGVKITSSSAPDDLQQKILLETNQKKSTWGG